MLVPPINPGILSVAGPSRSSHAGSARVDATMEGYYQFGEIGGVGMNRTMDIEAYAFHFDAGLTLPVPMQPRLSAEFNTASGDSDPVMASYEGFDQLYPTNHIHFGYMDRMSWKNMNHLAFGLQLRPNKDSHFEVTGHFFSLKEEADGWYHAGQSAIFAYKTKCHQHRDRYWARSRRGLYPLLHPWEPRGLANRRRCLYAG